MNTTFPDRVNGLDSVDSSVAVLSAPAAGTAVDLDGLVDRAFTLVRQKQFGLAAVYVGLAYFSIGAAEGVVDPRGEKLRDTYRRLAYLAGEPLAQTINVD